MMENGNNNNYNGRFDRQNTNPASNSNNSNVAPAAEKPTCDCKTRKDVRRAGAIGFGVGIGTAVVFGTIRKIVKNRRQKKSEQEAATSPAQATEKKDNEE